MTPPPDAIRKALDKIFIDQAHAVARGDCPSCGDPLASHRILSGWYGCRAVTPSGNFCGCSFLITADAAALYAAINSKTGGGTP